MRIIIAWPGGVSVRIIIAWGDIRICEDNNSMGDGECRQSPWNEVWGSLEFGGLQA